MLWLGLANSALAQTTYSGNVPVNIPDAGCPTNVASNFTVGTGTVADVDIGIAIDHTYRGDLQLRLRAPDGTILLLANQVGGGLTDYNVLLTDETAQPTINNHTVNSDDATVTPWQRTFKPASPLSFFDGKSAAGTWSLLVCDNAGADVGSIVRANLIITFAPSNYADLSLTKTVSNATPGNGTNINYVLTVANAATSPLAASGITVRDILPTGVTFVSSSSPANYNVTTGVWTVGALAIGGSQQLTITATVNASSGAVVTNTAEVTASSVVDLDSTVNNGVVGEDDYAAVAFTVAGAQAAGTPPTLVCPVGSTFFDWASNSWTAGSLNNSFTPTGIGQFNIGITTDVAFVTGSPAINGSLNGGITGETGLFLNMNNNVLADKSTTVITLPGALPGLQFRLFDVDFNAPQFADQVTVTGSFNGNTVMPVLTNGATNRVVGNYVYGLTGAADLSNEGTVFVTFNAPVDTLTIVYGNHVSGPAAPGNQWMTIHDITMCNPQVVLNLTKVSAVFNDGSNPLFNTPGNDVMYTIAMSNNNSGSPTQDTVFMVDPLPSQLTFFNGDANGPSVAGTSPVIFTDNGSGLTFNAATDVRYAQTAPTSFAQCNYTPMAGYDPLVRYICVNPKGRMTGKSGTATPSFSISFRTRIN